MDGGENISDTEFIARSIKRAARRVQDFIRKRRGGGAGELNGLQVDDSAPAFPMSLVDMGSWNRLRECCSLHKIKQTDLRRLYHKYEHLLYADKHPDGRRKRKMRLSLYAFQDEYDHMPIEMVSLIYIPTIFIENVPGLRAPDDEHQVDFARFVIAAHDFCTKNPLELFAMFFSLLLPAHHFSPEAIISIRTFEVLLDMIHGGLTKPMLAILSEIFGQRWAAPLSEIMRLAFAVPPLLYPVWEFQLATKRKIFGLAFWDAHQPRKMAKDEVGFGVPENMVIAFKGIKSISDAWRIAAHRTMVKYGAGVDRSSEWWMQQDFEVESKLPVGQRRDVCVARMKNMFGYRATLFFLATVGVTPDVPQAEPPPITFEVTPNDTIAHVKERVEELAGIPVVQQRVLFRGRQLFETIDVERRAVDETKTILQALRDGAAAAGERPPPKEFADAQSLFLTLRVRGGMQTFLHHAANKTFVVGAGPLSQQVAHAWHDARHAAADEAAR